MAYAGKIFGKMRSVLLAASIAAVGTAVAASENLLVQNYETDTASVQALMMPIQPFLGGTQSNAAVIQYGQNNYANSGTTGTGNLSLIQQSGNTNRAVQAIEGSNSALLLVQGGNNNSVVQASQGDNNFQLVGVSGDNNQIAYIQKGDNLAGALDVRQSYNSTVLAIQTSQSGNYMMPVGLRGLENKNVVVVPGRMYVLPKR